MKKIFAAVAAILCSAGAVFAQQTIRSDKVSWFNTVSLTGKLAVELIPSDTNRINIELKDTDITKLEWGVTDSVLTVKLRPGGVSPKGSAVVVIHYRVLDDLRVNGAEVKTQDTLAGGMMSIDLSGGAKLTATVKCQDLDLKLSGNSAAQMDGYAKYFTLRAALRSKADARNLDAQSVTVQAYSNSELYVDAMERLVAETGTGGTVFYTGKPQIVKLSTKMGGNIHDIDGKR
ncbi:GIN domain-containing protein [Gallalistipes aquisgranensis]|uniref:GIN domain-containing protein n=1 Tax=Gallalistipes aquisgranensis TaxID=2779358 RepID=UPI001CF821C2|nr:DUF2807 domain-containing protein [Gallalistipes aquisgranensis]MBE5032942.1 DUF2807 domain-containing protein [Gallalistipes aquisgranensis]